ncbi:hypothetical protein [Streptomyces sp. NPDC051135]|uniref:hypothetical protein n=1 Tax=unclassified Streptomyces TaxID=2593676 RepID=UPI00342BC6B2
MSQTIWCDSLDVITAVDGTLEHPPQPLVRVQDEGRACGVGVDVMLMQVAQGGSSPKSRRLTTVDFAQDGADLFSDLCVNSRLPMLNRVDPYRTRILTSADMPQFISEIDATCDLTAEKAERDILQKIRGLAERCAAAACFELHLVGD